MAHSDFNYYDAKTGLLHGKHVSISDETGADDFARVNAPPGHVPIVGRFDHLSQRVDITTGLVVDWQPPQPSPDHEWDATTKRWQLNAAARQKALDQSLARHLESQQHGLMRRLALNPGDVDARAQLQALHDQITGLDGQQP